MFPLCLVFPPVDRHSRLDLSHYYTRFSYYTRHPFYSEATVGEEKFACRYTQLPFLLLYNIVVSSFASLLIYSIPPWLPFPSILWPLSGLRVLPDYHYGSVEKRLCGLEMKSYPASRPRFHLALSGNLNFPDSLEASRTGYNVSGAPS